MTRPSQKYPESRLEWEIWEQFECSHFFRGAGGFIDILNPLNESIIVNISGDVSQYYYDNY